MNAGFSDQINQLLIREKEKCIGCKLCMDNCPMLDQYCDSPDKLLSKIIVDQKVDEIIPYSCALCGQCSQVCPKRVDLNKVFLELRIDAVKKNKGIPKRIPNRPVKLHQKNSFSNLFTTDIEGLNKEDDSKESKIKRVFFPGCALTAYSPKMVMEIYDYLKNKLPGIGIMLSCCGNPTYSMGEVDKFNGYYKKLQEDFDIIEVDEIIVACQNCYKTLGKNSPNQKVTSLWDIISEFGIPKDKVGKGKNIKKTFAIHDPCPTRENSHIHDSVRSIIDEVGLSVSEMKFSREKTLCCGSGGMLGITNKDLAVEQMKRRANQTENKYIITYCQECVESMKRGGKKSIHLLDLLFCDDIYINNDFNQKERSTLKKWFNRYTTKVKILKNAGKRKAITKYAVLFLVVVSALYLSNKYNIIHDYRPEQIRDFIDSFGALGPIIYIIMFTLVPLTLFPDSIIAIAGGMCFGLMFGSLYTMIGAVFGGSLSFYLSRFIGKGRIKSNIKKDLGKLRKHIEEQGFFVILIMRLIPLLPFDVISYGAGLSNIKYKDFLVATIVGIIPGVLVFTNVGDKATEIGSLGFYISISLLILLFIAAGILKKRLLLKVNNNKGL